MTRPVDPHHRGVVIFRWCIFLLAAGYVIRQLVLDGDYSETGGPFRYLTNWALLLSFFCASRMLALSERRSSREWETLVSVTAVVNVIMVGLYWAIKFDDPANLNTGRALPFWADYYLHLIGPLLQWIDAVFVHGAFRRQGQISIWLIGTISVYLAFIELIVAPNAEFPYGAVTSGLPYPFLNNMLLIDRFWFYISATVAAFVALAVFAVIANVYRRRRTRR
jgi:uncharacterized membrane protein YjjB (DUF3815 family)